MTVVVVTVVFLLLLLVTRHNGDRLYERAAFVALSGHVLVSIAILPRLPFGWDISTFHQRAVEIASGTFDGGSLTVSSFAGFQALVYTLFTQDPTTLSIVNGLLAVLLVLPAGYLARNLYEDVSSDTPGLTLVILFLPLQFLFLTIPMRDTLTVLSFFTLLGIIVHTVQTQRLTLGVSAIPLWGILYLFRAELALIIFLGVATMSVVMVVRAAGADLSLISLGAISTGIGSLGFGLFARVLYPFEEAATELNYRSRGGAVYLDGMQYESWYDFLLAIPARGLYFQFAPFPLHVASIFHFLGLFGTICIIILLVSGIRSLINCESNELIAVLLSVTYLAGIAGYGSINSNFGTNVRHRMVFDFLLVVFASPVLERWWSQIYRRISVVPGQRDDRQE